MFAVTRSIRVANNPRGAIAHATKIVEHIRTWKGVEEAHCWMAVSGPSGTLIFVISFEDAKTWEKTFAGMMSDDAYWKLVDAGMDMFDFASAQDSVLRQVT